MTMARVGVNDGVVVPRCCLEIEGGRAAPDARHCLTAGCIGDEAPAILLRPIAQRRNARVEH